MIPSKENLTICFAHAAYQMQDRFELRKTGIRNFQVRAYDDLVKRIGEADVLVVSGMWQNDLHRRVPAGSSSSSRSARAWISIRSEQLLRARGIRLASAAGVNARAVAEHAMALILALARRLPEARDNQAKQVWRGMIGDLDPARGRARRQDAADRRHGPHRRPARPARQGLRHARDRHPPRSARRAPTAPIRSTRMGELVKLCRRPTSSR